MGSRGSGTISCFHMPPFRSICCSSSSSANVQRWLYTGGRSRLHHHHPYLLGMPRRPRASGQSGPALFPVRRRMARMMKFALADIRRRSSLCTSRSAVTVRLELTAARGPHRDAPQAWESCRSRHQVRPFLSTSPFHSSRPSRASTREPLGSCPLAARPADPALAR